MLNLNFSHPDFKPCYLSEFKSPFKLTPVISETMKWEIFNYVKNTRHLQMLGHLEVYKERDPEMYLEDLSNDYIVLKWHTFPYTTDIITKNLIDREFYTKKNLKQLYKKPYGPCYAKTYFPIQELLKNIEKEIQQLEETDIHLELKTKMNKIAYEQATAFLNRSIVTSRILFQLNTALELMIEEHPFYPSMDIMDIDDELSEIYSSEDKGEKDIIARFEDFFKTLESTEDE